MQTGEGIALTGALVFGAVIGYVDSRPTWDDTGVTAAALLATSALFGAMAPRRAWLVALAVGGWVPLVGILGTLNFGSLIALAFAFAGAYAGKSARRILAATVK